MCTSNDDDGAFYYRTTTTCMGKVHRNITLCTYYFIWYSERKYYKYYYIVEYERDNIVTRVKGRIDRVLCVVSCVKVCMVARYSKVILFE